MHAKMYECVSLLLCKSTYNRAVIRHHLNLLIPYPWAVFSSLCALENNGTPSMSSS